MVEKDITDLENGGHNGAANGAAMTLENVDTSTLGATRNANASVNELAFHDICYALEVQGPSKKRQRGRTTSAKETLQILSHVSGQTRRSEMFALMGPSGSGKTSLLNVLAQRVRPSAVTGGVFIDGRPISKSFKRCIAFVFQDELMLWNLTVRETVLYAARLRLPQQMPEEQKANRVDDLLKLLGLTHVADTIIGKEARRGVSGGERKRTAIGVEMVTGPSILFLDEPTSGLDASTALSIVSLLKALAVQTGLMVICSIHQPRANIFSKFDKLLLLARGRTVFYGDRSRVVPYLNNLGLQLPPETNAADWILDIIALDTKTAEGKGLADVYSDDLATMDASAHAALGLPTASTLASAASQRPVEVEGPRWATSFWYQLRVLLDRQQKQSRGEMFAPVNVFQILAVAIVASAVWWQSTNISDLTGVLFFISIQQSFNAMNAIMRVFPAERGLMMRERSTGSYRVGPYFLAKSSSDVALYIVLPILYGTMVYWAVGLRPMASRFFLFLFLFITEILTAQSLGMFLSAAIPDYATAQSVSFVLVLIIMLFGGFYVNNSRIPTGVQWIKYLSFLYWGYGALIVNEFEGRSFPCSYATQGSYGSDTTCPIAGETVLETMGYNDMVIWKNIVILWAMIFFLRYVCYWTLRKRTRLVH